jgi:hypothetical protein
MNNLLTRYWFATEVRLGIGVTAYSLDDARSLIENEPLVADWKILNVTEDVDIGTLDQGHVIPNMGPPNVRGIWYPNLHR